MTCHDQQARQAALEEQAQHRHLGRSAQARSGQEARPEAEAVELMVSARGGRHGFVYRSRHSAYRALRRKGKSKRVAAMISNRGDSFGERSAMARKGWRGRKGKGRGKGRKR